MCKRQTNQLPPARPPAGTGSKPRHIPWLGSKLVTLWFAGQHSVHWATPARVITTILKICYAEQNRVRSPQRLKWRVRNLVGWGMETTLPIVWDCNKNPSVLEPGSLGFEPWILTSNVILSKWTFLSLRFLRAALRLRWDRHRAPGRAWTLAGILYTVVTAPYELPRSNCCQRWGTINGHPLPGRGFKREKARFGAQVLVANGVANGPIFCVSNGGKKLLKKPKLEWKFS